MITVRVQGPGVDYSYRCDPLLSSVRHALPTNCRRCGAPRMSDRPCEPCKREQQESGRACVEAARLYGSSKY